MNIIVGFTALLSLYVLSNGCHPLEHTKNKPGMPAEFSNANAMQEKVLEFMVTGGDSPSSYEITQLYEDGSVISLVGCAWPQGEHQNEVGIYKMPLTQEELKALQKTINSFALLHKTKTYGQLYTDSGRELLKLFTNGTEKTIQWNPYSDLPTDIKTFRDQLLALRNHSKQFPVNVLRSYLTVDSSTIIKGSHAFTFQCHLENAGSDTVKILDKHPNTPLQETFMSYIVEPMQEKDIGIAPIVQTYYEGKKIKLGNRLPFKEKGPALNVPPDTVLKFTIQHSFDTQANGKYRIFSLLEIPIEFNWEEKDIVINCIAILPPLEVNFPEKK